MIRKIILSMAVCALAHSGHAQISITDIIGSEGIRPGNALNITKEALKPELYVIRQQYRLKLNNKFYGKNHNDYYGETYSLGVKVAGGMFFTDYAVEPWKNDTDYIRVNSDGKYEPELFKTYSRALNDSVYKEFDLEYGSAYTKPANGGKTLWMHTDASLGLEVDDSSEKRTGYLLWVYNTSENTDEKMSVDLRQSTRSFSVKSDSLITDIQPSNTEKVIGGLFVVPVYSSGGRIQLMLSGVAVRHDGKWALQLLAKKDSKQLGESRPVATTAEKADPKAKKGKKVRKQEPEPDPSQPTPTN